MGLGTKIKAQAYAALAAAATPASGVSPEAIWHQFYDTQNQAAAGQTILRFFQVTNTDQTITNVPAAGQLPDPQFLAIHDMCCDLIAGTTAGYVSGTATATAAGPLVGNLNDFGLVMFSGRPVWILYISDKRYGPYSLSTLHGTGAIVGGLAIAGTFTATALGVGQYGYNSPMAGWNYEGSLIIPPKTNFQVEVDWSAAITTSNLIPIRISLFGVLARRVV